MTETGDRLTRLSSALFPADFPIQDLPVDGFKPLTAAWQPRLAAVLVPIVLEPEPAVILTVRSSALTSHAGQVALPGGGRSQDEAFPIRTALRELEEEVGIASSAVQVLGLTRCFDTITAYRIVPVVGIVDGPLCLQPCPREVLAIFRLPLAQVLDRNAYRWHHVLHGRRRYEVLSMRSACWPVWGATAAILAHLADLAAGHAGLLCGVSKRSAPGPALS